MYNDPERPYPPVTALIPAYNAGLTIERTLASVWRQNYPEIEIIVVDDASTDDTCTRVQNFGLSNLRLIQLKKNHGVAGALNAGILEAGTEFIAFLDADDEWLDGKLIKQLPIINTHPEMTFIACGGEDVDPAGLVHHTFGLEPPPILEVSSGGLCCAGHISRERRLSPGVPHSSKPVDLTRG